MRALLVSMVVLAACGSGNTYLSTEELMKPETCMQCHADHYTQWSGSMHAYASNDPVFLAMNARGQKDTAGQLGSFCVQCHAPLAVKLGLTTDGTNLDSVPQYAKGVTCYFCHTVDSVDTTHGAYNNPLVLATDDTMRGGIPNPVDSPAHRATHSGLLDGHDNNSATMCGACHDVFTPAQVHLERTFTEWQGTIFGDANNPRTHLTCGTCHMFATDGVVTSGPGAATLDVPLRPLGVHEHTFGGIDEALTDWPDKTGQVAAITRDLGPAIGSKLCVSPNNGGQIEVTLDDRGPGHNWPSGAAQDRRAWLELIAYDSAGAVLFSSGVVPDDKDPEDTAATDPNLWAMNDKVTDSTGQPAHFFWEVAQIDGSATLPPAVTTDISDPRYYHAVTHTFPTPGMVPSFAKVDMRVRIRPMPHAVLNDLISGGELDATAAGAMPTIELAGTKLEWTSAMGVTNCAM